MLKAIRTFLLIILLACSAQAGYIPNDAPAAPPPASADQEPAGDEDAPEETPDDTTNSLTEIVLDLLSVLPSLF